MVVGLKFVLFVIPPLHTYVFAPEPTNFIDSPKQIVCDCAVIVGKALTVTVELAVFEQLFPSVPVTIYVVVVIGLKLTLSFIPPSQI